MFMNKTPAMVTKDEGRRTNIGRWSFVIGRNCNEKRAYNQMTIITSLQNPLLKRIKRLRQKKYRQAEGCFYVEGLRATLTAVEQGASLDSVVYAPDLLTSEVGLTAVVQLEQQGVPVFALSAAAFQAISERENPVGLGAVVQAKLSALADLSVDDTAVYVALVDIGDPGNLGTIVRAADAVGAAGVILAGQTVDVFHGTAVKASMGAIFTVPLVHLPDIEPLWAWAAAQGVSVVATSARAEENYWMADYGRPCLLLMGSEGEGLDAATLARADQRVSIPMRGSATSLNLAMATGLMLYEILRRGD
jgi:RNA methyltransferase, TrmH family